MKLSDVIGYDRCESIVQDAIERAVEEAEGKTRQLSDDEWDALFDDAMFEMSHALAHISVPVTASQQEEN